MVKVLTSVKNKIKKPDKIVLYKDPGGEIRWTRRNSGNHKIVGASSQGYNKEKDALKNIKSTQKEPYTIVRELN